MRLLYVAHPLGSDPEQRQVNVERAERWCRWLSERFDVAALAPWTTLARGWPERGLAIDRAVIERCDGFALVGGRLSEGMLMERQWATDADRRVFDLTRLGSDPPQGPLAPEGTHDLMLFGVWAGVRQVRT